MSNYNMHAIYRFYDDKIHISRCGTFCGYTNFAVLKNYLNEFSKNIHIFSHNLAMFAPSKSQTKFNHRVFLRSLNRGIEKAFGFGGYAVEKPERLCERAKTQA